MPSSPGVPLTRGALAVLIAVFAITWFAGSDYRTLLHPDEGRYAEIPREMIVTGDWMTPRLNGLKYFEKPPLQYWLTAIGYKLFGVHNWTARLWPALSALLAALFLGYAAARVGGRTLGLYTGAVLLGCVGYIVNAHLLTLDAGLSAFLSLAFGAFLIAQRNGASRREERNWMWLAYAGMAGATLSKGLIGIVIPGATLVVYTLLTRDIAVWRRLHLVSGTLIYLALTAPWFVLVSRANEGFFQFFFIHEHFQRYLTTTHRRDQSWWYFVPLFVLGSLPWLPLLTWGAWRMWRDGTPAANGFSWQRFAYVWTTFIFLFFSASGSKLPSYIVPMFPVLAMLTAWLLENTENRVLTRLTWPIASIVAVLLVVLLAAYEPIVRRVITEEVSLTPALEFGPWFKAALAVGTLGGLTAMIALRRETSARRTIAVLALSLAVLVATQIGLAGYDKFRAVRSSRDILAAAEAVNGPFLPDVPFYHVHMFDQTVPFLLQRTTTFVEYRDEFALGIDAEPAKAVHFEADWRKIWEGLPQGYAMMPADDYDRMVKEGVPLRRLAGDSRRVIVSRR
jgi:4-amino-4-deoxy-L-arabinose transferase-like glycosyltransferase